VKSEIESREIFMSSPIHLDPDVDPGLVYAPPWARALVSGADSAVASPANAEESSGIPEEEDLEFSGDRAILELQRELARNPDFLPEPRLEQRSTIRSILARFVSAISLAAVIAWAIASHSGVKKDVDISLVETSAAVLSHNPGDQTDQRVQPAMVAAQIQPSPVTTSASAARESSPLASTVIASADPATAVVASVEPQAKTPSAQTPKVQSNDSRTPRLDDSELEMLVKRGNDFLGTGDLVSARLLFRRAAEGGSAEGALALGATFDPVVMLRLGAVGTAPDVTQARQWYQRAIELGSATASQRLAGLQASR
jgi:hypothetical protein